MFKSIIKIAAATALFAGIHSLLASKPAKEKAVELFGERKRNGLYRVLYNGFAILTLGALGLYAFKLPNRDLYRIRGPLAWLMHISQFCFLLYLLDGTRQIGFLKFAGITNAAALITGESFIAPEPEGQGPALRPDGKEIKIAGPFQYSRHPLNFGMLPVIWLMPRMTVNLAAFNSITTLYLLLGSFHEEFRLVNAYRQAFENYRNSGINFFVPSISRLIKE